VHEIENVLFRIGFFPYNVSLTSTLREFTDNHKFQRKIVFRAPLDPTSLISHETHLIAVWKTQRHIRREQLKRNGRWRHIEEKKAENTRMEKVQQHHPEIDKGEWNLG
jgi:hypothetical protein